MTRIVLHDYFRSSASYRVRIALNLKRLSYEQHSVSLAKGEQQEDGYKALNPQGFVPMLAWDSHRITQSLAIFDWLDAQVKEPPFVPDDPAGRAHVLSLALTVACDIHPLNNLRVLKYLKSQLGQTQDSTDSWYRHWVAEGLAALEALAAPKAGCFLYGDEVGMADICLVPQLYNARRFDVALDPYPTLLRAQESALVLPAFQAAHPDRQEVQA